MQSPIEQAAEKLGAVPADIPGLWCVPGYPELTTGQLLDAAGRVDCGSVSLRLIAENPISHIPATAPQP